MNRLPLASLVAQMVKNLPAMQETWVRSLSQEDPLEKRMAIHSSILAWRILWTEEPGGLWPIGSQKVSHNRGLTLPLSLFPSVPIALETLRKKGTWQTHSKVLGWPKSSLVLS